MFNNMRMYGMDSFLKGIQCPRASWQVQSIGLCLHVRTEAARYHPQTRHSVVSMWASRITSHLSVFEWKDWSSSLTYSARIFSPQLKIIIKTARDPTLGYYIHKIYNGCVLLYLKNWRFIMHHATVQTVDNPSNRLYAFQNNSWGNVLEITHKAT